MQKFSVWVSTFGGVGFFKHAPGTLGSLTSLLIWAPCLFWGAPIWVRLALIIGLFLIGCWSTANSIPILKNQDPKEVVIDEVVGQGLALLLCPPSWFALGAGFVLFRLFDILKPWPISWVDRKVKNSFGVMLDDVLAGVFACVILGLFC